MAYPEQLLADDEKVVKHLHPHWITLVFPIALFVVTVAVASFLASLVPAGSMQAGGRIAIGAVALVLLLLLAFVPFLRWRTTHYVLTTHRVMIRVGILHHRGRDVPLNRITDVSFEQTLWERMIGAGTLAVESAGESGLQVLEDIPRAPATQQLVNRLVERDHDRRTREAAHYEARYEAEYDARYDDRVGRQSTERLDGH